MDRANLQNNQFQDREINVLLFCFDLMETQLSETEKV